MKLNLTDNESLVFGHVGEVVLVYDSKYNLIWYHPNPDMHGKDEYDVTPGIRVWYNDKDGKHLATFILAVGDTDFPHDKLYGFTNNADLDIIELIDIAVNVSICEDMTIWGQAQFDEPYNAFMYNIYNQNFTCTYSHDCGIRPAPDYGFDT